MSNKNIMTGMLAAMSLPLMAANPDVKGTIIDENGEPMSFVNVVLLSAADSSFIQGATSDSAGVFNIVTPATQGILKVSSVGYETQYFNTSDFRQGNLRIQMRENNAMLGEVTVKAQLPKTKLTGNSMVTSIKGSVLEKSGTAKEMLAKVPGMTLKDDELEVLSKGQPVFYINGRKVTDKDEFKRLRSEEIQEVEVIQNPGAQYDATVTAVVRIKTIRREGTGFGYDLSAGNNQDLRFGNSDPNATVNLRYRHNSIDFFGLINYWKWDNVNALDATQETYMLSDGNLSKIDQHSDYRNTWQGQGLNYNLGFNWQITNDHSVGMRVERHDKFRSGSIVAEATRLSNSVIDQQIKSKISEMQTRTSQRSHDSQPYSYDGNAYYCGKIGKLGIDFNVDFVANKNKEVNRIIDHNAPDNRIESVTPGKTRMIADKLTLSYPVWKGQLQAGTEMSFVGRESSYRMSGMNLPSSESEVNEKNIAAFMQYGCMIPQVGNLSLGVRYEHVGFDYTDCLDGQKSMSRYTNDFFPSVNWANQFGDWQLSASYSYKTNRPQYWHLSESVFFLNAYSLQQGDPKLKDEKIQEVSTNVRWKWINLFAAYERRDNFVTQWSYVYDSSLPATAVLKDFGEGTILIKHINMDVSVRNFAAFLTASPTFGCYSPSWSVGLQRYDVKLDLADPREADNKRTVHYHKPFGFLDINNTFRFKHSWQLEANGNVMTKGDYSNFYFARSISRVNFVVQKCWLKNDALCLRASVQDAFRGSKQRINMDCGYYQLDQRTYNSSHRLDISLRYTFNATQSKYKGTGAGREAANRMSK